MRYFLNFEALHKSLEIQIDANQKKQSPYVLQITLKNHEKRVIRMKNSILSVFRSLTSKSFFILINSS